MLVLKTTSPAASPSAPNEQPSKQRPSAKANIAGFLIIAFQFSLHLD
jgi:hypothetical protein